jgi:hypothetical protein
MITLIEWLGGVVFIVTMIAAVLFEGDHRGENDN